jgi:hypothetical protein
MKSLVQERRLRRAALSQDGYADVFAGKAGPDIKAMSRLDRQWYMDGAKIATSVLKQQAARRAGKGAR